MFSNEEHIFCEMNDGCKVSFVKIIVWVIIFTEEGTNTLSFDIFNYGTGYGGECSAESGAKYYFIKKRNLVRPKEPTEKEIDGASSEF